MQSQVQTEHLEATLGLDKCLEISKELIRECVTCLVLLHATLALSFDANDGLVQLCTQKYITPLPPLNPP